jgi:outer membrane protein TolC
MALLDLVRAQATDLGIERALLEHAIAVLLGQPASVFSLASAAGDLAPVRVPVGIPAQLLERRPDVAAAERRVAEANAQIGVARAAYFPALSLNASAGFVGSAIGDLLSVPSFVWSVGASLSQTLFDGGKRAGVTAQAWAGYQGTVANYRQTVLGAFQNVEDSLGGEHPGVLPRSRHGPA